MRTDDVSLLLFTCFTSGQTVFGLETKHPHRDKHGKERHADVLPRLKRWQGPKGDEEVTLLVLRVLAEHHPQLMLHHGAKQELDQGVHQRDAQKGAGQTRCEVEYPGQGGELVVGGGAVPNMVEAPQVTRADSVHKSSQRGGDGGKEGDKQSEEGSKNCHRCVCLENNIIKKKDKITFFFVFSIFTKN